MAVNNRAPEITNNLESYRCTILDFNEKVSHAVTSLIRLNKNLQIDIVLGSSNDSMDYLALLSPETAALSYDVDVERVLVLAFHS